MSANHALVRGTSWMTVAIAITLSGGGCPADPGTSAPALTVAPGLYGGVLLSTARVTTGTRVEQTGPSSHAFVLRISAQGLPLVERVAGPEYVEGWAGTISLFGQVVDIEVTRVSTTPAEVIVEYDVTQYRMGYDGPFVGTGEERYVQDASGVLDFSATIRLTHDEVSDELQAYGSLYRLF